MSHGNDMPHYSVTSSSNPGPAHITQALLRVVEEKKYKKIINRWNDVASKIDIPSTELPKYLPIALNPEIQSQIYEGPSDDAIQKELEKTREEFLLEIKGKEANLKNRLETGYKEELDKKDEELERSCRIMNIQNAILLQVYEKNRDIFLKVLQDAEITEDELKALQAPFPTNR
jgi:hypothetical protein